MGGRDHAEVCETCGEERGGMNDVWCSCDYAKHAGALPEDLVFALTHTGEELLNRMATLAQNLRVGAALCWAEKLGWVNGYNDCTEAEGCNAPFEEWRSGGGVPAPACDARWPTYRRHA